MYKEVLSSIDGVSLFPVVAIVLFMVIFTLIFIYVVRMDKSKVDRLAALPIKPDFTQDISLNGKADKS